MQFKVTSVSEHPQFAGQFDVTMDLVENSPSVPSATLKLSVVNPSRVPAVEDLCEVDISTPSGSKLPTPVVPPVIPVPDAPDPTEPANSSAPVSDGSPDSSSSIEASTTVPSQDSSDQSEVDTPAASQ